MSQRKKLLEITYHSDDDTGMYEVGEIDHGICDVEGYIDSCGQKGRNAILLQLAYLMAFVQNITTPETKAQMAQCGQAASAQGQP